ncbi:MAG: hypothetical protein IT406_02625 [Candidatus Yanofskybacteria bacterium]|nr:hypothetical protein [Candidatus Yanofskybacteria bacterium]
MKLSKKSRGILLILGIAAVVVSIGMVLSGYELGIGRFFAAEITSTPSPTPMLVNDAKIVYVLVSRRTMYIGETQEVYVTFKNTGTKAWDVKGSPGNYTSAYRIKSWGPADNTTWGTSFIPLPYAPVPSGQSATFTFLIKAPFTPGTYNFQWRMNQGGVGWFGQENPPVAITVMPRP